MKPLAPKTIAEAKNIVAALMSEAELTTHVLKYAEDFGWTLRYHTHRSDRSDKGWVDWVFANLKQSRVIFVELKSQKGKVSPEQADWLAALKLCGQESYLFRPEDLRNGSIERVLGG